MSILRYGNSFWIRRKCASTAGNRYLTVALHLMNQRNRNWTQETPKVLCLGGQLRYSRYQIYQKKSSLDLSSWPLHIDKGNCAEDRWRIAEATSIAIDGKNGNFLGDDWTYGTSYQEWIGSWKIFVSFIKQGEDYIFRGLWNNWFWEKGSNIRQNLWYHCAVGGYIRFPSSWCSVRVGRYVGQQFS